MGAQKLERLRVLSYGLPYELTSIVCGTQDVPYLYKLLLALTRVPGSGSYDNQHTVHQQASQRGRELIEVIPQSVGFRTSDISDGVYLHNGLPIKFKGVNRHEHNPDTGHVVSEDDIIAHLVLLKQVPCSNSNSLEEKASRV